MSRIKELRKKAGFTQVKFAEAMGVTQSSGRVLPDTAKLPQLAEVLNCTISDLFAPAQA